MTATMNQDISFGRQFGVFMRTVRSHARVWMRDDLDAVSQSMAIEETRLPRLLTLTMATLSAAAAIFVLWAALTPVKEIARTEGQVLPSGYSQLVQHLEGGLVQEILVHEGDFVQKDQLLVKLDGAGLQEDYNEQHATVESLALQSERLRALVENRKPNFTGLSQSEAAIAEQQRMYDATIAAHQSERAVLDEQIGEKTRTVSRLKQSVEVAESNLGVAQENEKIYSDLNAKGLTARTTYLKKHQELITQQGEVNSLAAQLDESKRELAEYQHRREALELQQRDTAYAELQKAQAELAPAKENLKKRNDRVDRLEIRAPVMGYVKGLKINTIGSVIPAGQTLMEIVPAEEQLVVETRILPQQIGRVAIGQNVQVKVDSYDYVRYGTIPGTLESVSAMTFTDEVRRQDYYKGRVVLSRNYAGTVPGAHPVMPGMTVDADIVTGEKSILGYLLKPIQVAMHNAMTEQ
ncbi:MAG TPA: HlyD family type I secretion periplasmic adaptor subunit [Alphaproteobacteria bacterium]|nr:HlyD family type I secretion periplasmic adaptor subunit [Alphaproteobacteria bacterium]